MAHFLRNIGSVLNYYIHLPFCAKKCHYCAFPVHVVGTALPHQQSRSLFSQYTSALMEQISVSMGGSETSKQPIQSIYLGGGTPSLMSAAHISKILSPFSSRITSNTEITMQMNLQEAYKITDFLATGVNRLSVGIQTLNEGTLSLFNRQSQHINTLVNQLAQARPTNLNLDFIIDMNTQDRDFDNMFHCIETIRPSHLTMYILQVNQQSYLHRNANNFGCAINRHERYQEISRKLTTQYGYDHYQISHFCRNGAYSRHNTAYWEGNRSFGAFGMGAASLLGGYRATRPKTLKKYYEYVQALKKQQDIHKYVQIDDQTNKQQSLKWILLSRLRRKSGIKWSQLVDYLTPGQMAALKQALIEIHSMNPNILNMQDFKSGFAVSVPNGYLVVDEIGYRLLQAIQK